MESTSANARVTFTVLQARLIDLVNARIQNGDFTERGLARILGVSQPQVHNVLKGARRLRPEFADRLISILEITIADLLETSEIREQLAARNAASSAWAVPAPGIKVDSQRSNPARPYFEPKAWPSSVAPRKPPRAAAQSTPQKQQAIGKI